MPIPDAPRVPATVKGLAAVSLLNDFASEMVYPLLPAFLTGTLGAGPVALGALDGAADLASSVIRWWSGPLADRGRWRLPLVWAGYAVATVLRPVMAVTSAAWQVIGVRMLDRMGKGLRSPGRDALIADATPRVMHGRAFGLHRTADHLGAVLGSLMAFELLRRGVPVRQVLGASLIPGIAALGVLTLVLWRARTTIAAEPAPSAPDDDSSTVPRGRLAGLALLAAVRLPEALILLRIQDLGLPVAGVPLVWAVLHIVKSAASYPSGWLADRVGVGPSLVLGTAAYAATAFGLSRDLSPTLAVGLFLSHGLAAGFLEPAERAAVARVAPSRRGRAFGTYQAMVGVGALIFGLGYGWLYQVFGGGLALLVAAGMSVSALGARRSALGSAREG